ncbi:hypothetical protein HPB50_025392 [Hyalomma asiaticum]|uniref:Uncharacterized protein n=1 Tax=Hyalomma asiaticum TaxID=266040 RepID=A0ACB7TRD2_HYAAI|nr:hypothetical protein HPB50_025392 [Hyalomma asiaticum]
MHGLRCPFIAAAKRRSSSAGSRAAGSAAVVKHHRVTHRIESNDGLHGIFEVGYLRRRLNFFVVARHVIVQMHESVPIYLNVEILVQRRPF